MRVNIHQSVMQREEKKNFHEEEGREVGNEKKPARGCR